MSEARYTYSSPTGLHRRSTSSLSWLHNLIGMLWWTLADIHLFMSWEYERLKSMWYVALSVLCRRRRKPRYAPDKTAIVVMSAGEGVGRMLSLKFAEVGYTVFACLSHDVQTPRGTHTSSTIPLLFMWQRHKARSHVLRESLWMGTIVPLVFDAAFPEECERAMDTIRAYCEQHSLKLTSVIIPPISTQIGSMTESPTAPNSPTAEGSMFASGSRLSTSAIVKRLKPRRNSAAVFPLVRTDHITVQEAMSKGVFQPLAMVQALEFVLHDAEGRVVFLEGCNPLGRRSSKAITTLTDAARSRTARTLFIELGAMRIHVATVATAALRRKSLISSQLDSFPDSLPRLMRVISSLWSIDEDTCFALVESIVESRYPRACYRFGFNFLVERFIPDAILDLVDAIIGSDE